MSSSTGELEAFGIFIGLPAAVGYFALPQFVPVTPLVGAVVGGGLGYLFAYSLASDWRS